MPVTRVIDGLTQGIYEAEFAVTTGPVLTAGFDLRQQGYGESVSANATVRPIPWATTYSIVIQVGVQGLNPIQRQYRAVVWSELDYGAIRSLVGKLGYLTTPREGGPQYALLQGIKRTELQEQSLDAQGAVTVDLDFVMQVTATGEMPAGTGGAGTIGSGGGGTPPGAIPPYMIPMASSASNTTSLNLWNAETSDNDLPPTDWTQLTFDASEWNLAIPTNNIYPSPFTGHTESVWDENPQDGAQVLLRQSWTEPVGGITAASLYVSTSYNVEVTGVWVNGDAIGMPGPLTGTTILDVAASVIPGDFNLIAVEADKFGGGTAGAVSYMLTVWPH